MVAPKPALAHRNQLPKRELVGLDTDNVDLGVGRPFGRGGAWRNLRQSRYP